MNMYDSLFSPSCVLNEQVARQLFELMPDGQIVMAIVDKEGHYWPNDTEAFSKLHLSESFLTELQHKIDDGHEPVISQVDDCSIIAAQLCTEKTRCGYILMALPQHSPEATLVNGDLIEIVLSQINLIARLIEKNNLLYELQVKHFNAHVQRQTLVN